MLLQLPACAPLVGVLVPVAGDPAAADLDKQKQVNVWDLPTAVVVWG